MRLSGSVKLRCALPSGSVFVGVLPLFLPPSATRRSSASARALRSTSAAAFFGLQRGLGLAYLLKPLLLVGHPIGHLVAALVAVELVLLRIGGLGGLEPAIDLRFKLRFPLLHPIVAHRLVLGRVRLDTGAVERHVPED